MRSCKLIDSLINLYLYYLCADDGSLIAFEFNPQISRLYNADSDNVFSYSWSVLKLTIIQICEVWPGRVRGRLGSLIGIVWCGIVLL